VTRVLIVEDQTLFAEAIRSSLMDLGIRVLELCGNGPEAMAVVRRERPDLVLLDIGLPGESGLAVGRQILSEGPGTKVVALTALDDARTLREAMRVGFHGYLTKDIPIRQFVRSISAVLDGQLVAPHRLARQAAGGRSADAEAAALLTEQLTAREREVLGLLVDGASGADIAKRLTVSPHTVRTHVQSILAKLQVHSRLEAASFAVRYGIVRPSARSETESGPDED
jgi:two-component system, NarL family, nitrate/nitrite response regulator NarL